MKIILNILIHCAVIGFFLLSHYTLFATHNRAGEIIYQQIGPLRIRATIITYTKASSVDADRDSLVIDWGDGSSQYVIRDNGNGEGIFIGNDTKYNLYTAEHTYAALSTYTISTTDPNRNAGILNVNPPYSENIPFFIETKFTLLNSQFQGYNSSPTLLQPPIDIGCVGQVFIHNPTAYDPNDQDSIAYELIVPKQFVNSDVPNYFYPNQISPGPKNKISLNPVTGDFVWDAPQKAGEYNIAILIKEYRQGILINSMVRDMQILILDNCNNTPPVISAIHDTCIVAGQLLSFNVTATDIDIPKNKIRLTATGGPFNLVSSPAVFNAPVDYADQPVTGTFSWTPDCNAINSQYYIVTFKATDNKFSQNDTLSGLSDLKTIRIKVVGPSPENLAADATGDAIELTWDSPYICENTANSFFRGFNIWRKENSGSFLVDSCAPTMKNKGFQQIAFSVKNKIGNSYTYLDSKVEKGVAYCYRIEGVFAKLTSTGLPFNEVTSLPSNEVCTQLKVDIPLITNVSIRATNQTGKVWIKWVLPLASVLDTIAHPGPYRYVLYRADGISGSNFSLVPGANFTSTHFMSNVPTEFLDSNVNTINQGYTYKLEFYTKDSGASPFGTSTPVSSIFLTANRSDKSIRLTWAENVPFSNYAYVVFKENDLGIFDSIATLTGKEFTDKNLVNGTQYCYKIKSLGQYNLSYIPRPLENYSQIACNIPEDTIAPCPPILEVTNNCMDNSQVKDFINHLTWQYPPPECTIDDAKGYIVYYQANPDSVPIELIRFNSLDTTTFAHFSEKNGLAGCYSVAVYDSVGNISKPSNLVCMQNCVKYILPNVFTPDGDGHNDIYKPFPFKFIRQVQFVVYNQWGNQVFSTSDPTINWTGTANNGKELASGTYYYICKVFPYSPVSNNNEPTETLKGYIELIR